MWRWWGLGGRNIECGSKEVGVPSRLSLTGAVEDGESVREK